MSKSGNKNVIFAKIGVAIKQEVCYNVTKLLFERSLPVMKRITSFLLAIVLFAGFVLTGVPTVQAAEMTSSNELVEMIKSFEGFTSTVDRLNG